MSESSTSSSSSSSSCQLQDTVSSRLSAWRASGPSVEQCLEKWEDVAQSINDVLQSIEDEHTIRDRHIELLASITDILNSAYDALLDALERSGEDSRNPRGIPTPASTDDDKDVA